MIQLSIDKTAKGYGPKEKWQRFGHSLKTFATLKDAKAWIKEEYGPAKRSPMFVDIKNGGAIRVGYVIGFRNSDISHLPIVNWIQQDWIEFSEVKTISPF